MKIKRKFSSVGYSCRCSCLVRDIRECFKKYNCQKVLMWLKWVRGMRGCTLFCSLNHFSILDLRKKTFKLYHYCDTHFISDLEATHSLGPGKQNLRSVALFWEVMEFHAVTDSFTIHSANTYWGCWKWGLNCTWEITGGEVLFLPLRSRLNSGNADPHVFHCEEGTSLFFVSSGSEKTLA